MSLSKLRIQRAATGARSAKARSLRAGLSIVRWSALVGMTLAMTASSLLAQPLSTSPINPESLRGLYVRRLPAVSPYVHLDRTDFHAGVPFYHLIVRDAQLKRDQQLAQLALRDKAPPRRSNPAPAAIGRHQVANLQSQLSLSQLNQPTLQNPYVQDRIRQIDKLHTILATSAVKPQPLTGVR